MFDLIDSLLGPTDPPHGRKLIFRRAYFMPPGTINDFFHVFSEHLYKEKL